MDAIQIQTVGRGIERFVSVRRTTGQLRVPPAGNVLRACSAAGQGFGR
jgi:hypothetical protein